MSWLKRKKDAFDEGKFDCEISFHIEELTRANVAEGMTPEEARRSALLAFGGQEQVKQQIREVHLSSFLEAVRANLRSAMRFIRRSPSFAAAVVLTLALGIGANSAVFSAIDAVLLRPLSFPHGDELMEVHQQDTTKRSPQTFVAPVRLEDWNRYNSTFQGITGYYTQSVSLRSGELPERVTQAFVASRFLQVWGGRARVRPRFYERGAEVRRTTCGSGQRPVLAEPSAGRPECSGKDDEGPVCHGRRRLASLFSFSGPRC